MFSKIPQRFSAPFGLLGDEAKLAFPSQPEGIMKLATFRNIPETDSYWEQYFTLFDSASEVYSLITPHHIRRALAEAPENVATLIGVVTSRLFKLISDHTFPSPINGTVASYATSFIKSAVASQEKNTTKELLNCLRILQRVLPVIFEVQGETSTFEMEVIWKKQPIKDQERQDANAEPQFVIDDDDAGSDTEEQTNDQSPPSSAAPTPQTRFLPSIGERLFDSLVDLLFCCGFTIPKEIQVDHHKINYVIWEKGIGSTASLNNNNAIYDNNKTEVLRLLLVLLSRQIYIPASSLFTHPSTYSTHLVQRLPRRDVLTLLCSLLNTAITSSSAEAITIGTIAGKLPYNHLVFKGEDPRTTLITTCLQVLDVLLDFQSGSARDPSNEGQSAPTSKSNAFRYFIMKLHRVQDFQYLFSGTMKILADQASNINNLLPGAKKSLPYVNEFIILFWKLIELNKKFRTFVLESEQSMDFLAYLLFYCVDIKDKPQQHGLCRAISYIVQTLSAEPSFGSSLEHPLHIQLTSKWGPVSNGSEFMIQAIYSIVATTGGSLTSLYPALVIALANAAPYFKHIGISASARLLQLFNSFSNPLFLLSDEGHPRLLFFMLEVFSAILYYHPSENPNITYGILQSRKIFEDLGTFTLARGLREVRRAQLAKEERANRVANPKARASASDDLEAGDPAAEKARFLQNEGVINSADIDHGSDGTRSSYDEAVTASMVSPTSENPYPGSPLSEKARGKMRERRSLSVDNVVLERVPPGLGRNGFVPTQEWVTSWQQGLPLDAVMLFISDLVQKVEEMQKHGSNASTEILKFLSSVNLDHIYTQRPPIIPRCFQWSDASMVWLTSLIWGEIYVRGMTPLGIWNGTNVRLFFVKHTQNQQRQITETVTNVVGGFLRRTSDNVQSRQRPT
ncbi:high-temperature-induced dauer-formation protein-domain-containing protein [Panaeolus papilionaceus]|nr:high-temperature-induced dauer-formation protein-domain-containing protein [Panaeolus papilionaceus]